MTDSNMAAHILSSVWVLLLCILMPFSPKNALFNASDEKYFPFNVFTTKSCKTVRIGLIMSILLSVHTEEPLNGYAFSLKLWSYTKNWTTFWSKSDNNNGHFTYKATKVLAHILHVIHK